MSNVVIIDALTALDITKAERDAAVRHLAKRAAEVIAENGWHQGYFYDSNHRGPSVSAPVCLVGALCVASGRAPYEEPDQGEFHVFDDARRRIANVIGARVDEVADWNDAEEREASDVIAVLERVAAGEGAP